MLADAFQMDSGGGLIHAGAAASTAPIIVAMIFVRLLMTRSRGAAGKFYDAGPCIGSAARVGLSG